MLMRLLRSDLICFGYQSNHPGSLGWHSIPYMVKSSRPPQRLVLYQCRTCNEEAAGYGVGQLPKSKDGGTLTLTPIYMDILYVTHRT